MIDESTAARGNTGESDEPQWMKGFGALRRFRREATRIQARIDEEFSVIHPEDRV